MIILFEAGRLTSYFTGMVMMLIAVVFFWRQWCSAYSIYGFPANAGKWRRFISHAFNPALELRTVSLESLHRRSFAAGLCALGAFSIPLLYDFNVLLSERGNNPVLAVLAVYGLLYIQVSLVKAMASRPRMAMMNVAGVYVFAVLLVLANDASLV